MAKNTLFVVIVLSILASLIIGINVGKQIEKNSVILPATPSSMPTSTQITYASGQTCGVTFTYPGNFEKLESSNSGLILADQTNPENSVVFVCQPEIPRVPLPPEKIESLTIPTASGSGFIATLYHDASQKDGTPIDKVIFTHPVSGIDVYIAGFGDAYTKLIHTLRLP